MKKLLVFSLGIATILSMGMTSCKSDNGSEPSVDTPETNPIKLPLDPTESKRYMEETAELLSQKFNPADQEELITLANDFDALYGDFDAPEEFEESYTKSKGTPVSAFMNVIRKEVANGNYAALTRASSYKYKFENYAGVYEPANHYWRKTSDSNDIIFRFEDKKGKKCELKATQTGSNSYFNYDDGYDRYDVTIPQSVTVTLTQAGKKLYESTSETVYSEQNQTFTANINATAMNIGVETKTSGTNTKVSETSVVSVGGQKVISTTAEIGGNNLCNQKELENLFDNFNNNAVDRFFRKGAATVDVLGRIQIKSTLTGFSDFCEALDYDKDSYYHSDAQEGAQKAANTLNRLIEAKMYYAGSDVVQADVIFEPWINYVSSYNDEKHEWWSPRAMMVFKCDDSKYSFEEYFGNNRFSNTEDIYEDLLDKYDRYWR